MFKNIGRDLRRGFNKAGASIERFGNKAGTQVRKIADDAGGEIDGATRKVANTLQKSSALTGLVGAGTAMALGVAPELALAGGLGLMTAQNEAGQGLKDQRKNIKQAVSNVRQQVNQNVANVKNTVGGKISQLKNGFLEPNVQIQQAQTPQVVAQGLQNQANTVQMFTSGNQYQS